MSVPDPATTKWVPLSGNVYDKMVYRGAYSGANTYNDGDCVVATDGILYICVQNGTTGKVPARWAGAGAPQGPAGPTGSQGVGVPSPVVNGQWVKGSGGAAVWSPITVADVVGAAAAPAMVTSLPASPVDGQEVLYVDSLTAPTRTWRCRYNAQSTNAYKWEVLGGTPLTGLNTTQQTVSAVTTWTNVVPTAITIPREGAYGLSGSLRVNNGYSGAQHIYMMMWTGTAGNVFGPQPLVGLNSGWWGTLAVSMFYYTLFAQGLGMSVYINAGGPTYHGEMSWSAMPLRLL